VIEDVASVAQMAAAIKEMHVRGAGLIGAAAGYGMYLATLEASGAGSDGEFEASLSRAAETLRATRPTAVNLAWAVERQMRAIMGETSREARIARAFQTAREIADEDAEYCRRIGDHGVKLIRRLHRKKGATVHILTHCNAGWLAFVDYGSATAPIYAAHDAGIPVHVWVDETRPRNQGAKLTAWELGQHGVPHTVIADNAGGHLMQHGMVDMVIVGTDRTTFTGDVANKIGTYLKALAAKDNNVPFYVALPSSTIDWTLASGDRIPIEERASGEVTKMTGRLPDGSVATVDIAAPGSTAANPAFDVTPARLVTQFITERGICEASQKGLRSLFPEMK
jgi:methylthioribose-1-phosphate isomerase